MKLKLVRKLSFFLIFILVSASLLSCASNKLKYEASAEISEVQFLEAEESSFIEINSCEIRIISNYEKTSVFLNGEFFGTTPLTIKDISGARFNLKVQKENAGEKDYIIESTMGMKKTFYCPL